MKIQFRVFDLLSYYTTQKEWYKMAALENLGYNQ